MKKILQFAEGKLLFKAAEVFPIVWFKTELSMWGAVWVTYGKVLKVEQAI